MGAILCFMYASSFSADCDMVVALDFLQVKEMDNIFLINSYQRGLNKILLSDEQKIAGTEPPSYSYKKIVEKLMSANFTTYTEESLQYLLVRGIKESKSNPNKYFFTRDNRLKTMDIFMVAPEVNVDSALRITAPYCFIKALRYKGQSEWLYVDEIMYTMKDCNSKFELYGVDGGHHVHLIEPEKVSPIISRFINNYRPENILSKL